MGLIRPNKLLKEQEIRPEAVRSVLHDVVVARLPKQPKYEKGFAIPEYIRKEQAKKQNIAKVVRLGEKYTGPVKVGDLVVFGSWEGASWGSAAEEDVIILKPEHIHAILVKDAE